MTSTSTDRPGEQTLVDELQRLADELSRPPSPSDVEEQSDTIAVDYVARFGSWDAALEAAGIAPRTRSERTGTETLLAELRFVADRTGDPVDAAAIAEYAPRPSEAYRRRFGSLAAALDRANCSTAVDADGISDAALERELRRVADDLGRPPNRSAIIRRGAYAPEAYVERYGSLAAAHTAAGCR